MAPPQRPPTSRVLVPLPWEILNGNPVSETNFLKMVGQLPVRGLLPHLIRLLQFGDASEPPLFEVLDRHILDLSPTATARRIANELERQGHWVFFSKWQLLLAIKLLCTFGSPDSDATETNDNELLDLLLMVNSLYPSGGKTPDTPESAMETVQEVALRGYSLIQYENPYSLIGPYADLFYRLTSPTKLGNFNAGVDIQKVLATNLGIQLDTFKAVLFALYAKSAIGASWPKDGKPGPQLGCLHPETYFTETQLHKDALTHTLNLVTTNPDEIREEHRSEYGENIGNPVDYRVLLKKPVLKLADGSLAGISGQLLVQRYTCGLYWDIHDALPDDTSSTPNRRTFQTFFGELHERYGREVLQRIVDSQKRARKKVCLLLEPDYPPGKGSNPDSLLVETIASSNMRCTMLEFKVGQPRYKDSLVEGDVRAFQKDLHRKIENGVDQEIDFWRHMLSGQREIPELPIRNTIKWFFAVVVTDPFPSMGIFLEPLRQRLSDLADAENAQLYGPFILSLSELEQLETLPNKRVSELLIEWANGPEQDWPFHSFYASRTKGQPVGNSHVKEMADEDLHRVQTTFFGESVQSP